ncbi:MAG: sulfotransferase [Erythrobacter sp.]|nr:sulfotransferase [Erythrobacter sp.]
MASKQTFILGVGCQKAGTTWLYDYLASRSDVTLPKPKELHVFDAMLRPDMHARLGQKHMIEHLSRSPKQRLKDALGIRKPNSVRPIERVEMVRNPQAYVDFFKGFDPSAGLIGEITPSYSTLSAKNFRFIRELLEPHFDLRVVLLLRDPVKRAFSASRHFARKHQEDFPMAFVEGDNEGFKTLLSSAFILERGDYESTLKALDEAFDPDQVHVEFFERLFTDEAVTALTDFLGLPPVPAKLDRRINAAPSKARPDPALLGQARERYKATYAYCAERFGKELIEELWSPPAD